MDTTIDCLLRDCYSVNRFGYCKTRKNNKCCVQAISATFAFSKCTSLGVL